jgi:uncharacterized membrane protein
MENDSKAWWQSKTIWGGLVVVIAVIAQAFGYTISEGQQADLVDIILSVVAAAGGVMAIAGRVMASKKLG